MLSGIDKSLIPELYIALTKRVHAHQEGDNMKRPEDCFDVPLILEFFGWFAG